MNMRSKIWLLALASVGCSTSPGGPTFHRLGIEARNSDGAQGEVACIRFPVLVGSQSLSRYIVDDRFDIVVVATRVQAEVTFESGGRPLPASRVIISSGQLSQGHFEEVLLPIPSGQLYTVSLSSECSQ